MEITRLDSKELLRRYHCKDGSIIDFYNVTHFLNSKTTHRLVLEDNTKIIFPTDQIKYIEIKTEKFTL